MDEGMNQVTPLLLQANLSLKFLNLCENELSAACCDGFADFLRQQRNNLLTFKAYTNELTSVGVTMLMGA